MSVIKQSITDQRGDKALRALAEGDMEALSLLYDLYGKLILSVAYTIMGNYADAEDVLQDVMIQLVRYAPSYQKGTSPRAFVLSMTRHRAIDLVRRRKSHLSTEEVGDIPVRDGDLAAVEVLDLLSSLSEEERQIVTLHLYAGLSHRRVAEILSLTTSATEKKYQRALTKLKKHYES